MVNRKLKDTYDLLILEYGKEEVIRQSIVSYSPPDWFSNETMILFVGSVNGNQELSALISKQEKKRITKNRSFDAMPVAQ